MYFRVEDADHFLVSRAPTIDGNLLLEPDAAAASTLVAELGRAGVQIGHEVDTHRAIARMARRDIDLIVASSRVGLEQLETVSAVGEELGIQVVYACGRHERDILEAARRRGLKASVRLPYDAMSVARVLRTTVRRNAREERISIGQLSIVVESFYALYQGRPLSLSPLEFAVLVTLARHVGRPVSRATLVAGIWGDQPRSDPGELLRALVARVRRKLEAVGAENPVHSIRGYGYVLDPLRLEARPSRFAQLDVVGAVSG